MKNFLKINSGQAVMEFTFAIIVTVLLIHALIMAFKWSSLDLANRRIAHDETLLTSINENWISLSDGPLKQIDENFFESENNLSLIISLQGGSGNGSGGNDDNGSGSGSGGNDDNGSGSGSGGNNDGGSPGGTTIGPGGSGGPTGPGGSGGPGGTVRPDIQPFP